MRDLSLAIGVLWGVLGTVSKTKHPEQGVSRVRNLLAQEMVPFQKDVLTVAADILFLSTR